MSTTPTPVPAQQQARPPIAHHHEFAEMVQSLFTIILIATFVTTFLVQPHQIPSASMEPTLLVGDFVLVTRNSYTPSRFSPLPHAPIYRGEIIVFLKPGRPVERLVKRVIGLPGDHIHLLEGRVYINGLRLNEPYAIYRTIAGTPFRDAFPAYADQDASVLPGWLVQLHHDTVGGDLVVPPHMYFVLGDNRNDSLDSRYWGFVPEANILGTPWLVYFSLHNDDGLPLNLPAAAAQRTVIDRIAGFARWDRCLHLVQ